MARQGEERGLGWLPHSRRWLLVAPALLLLWMVGQIDKTNISLIIADEAFLRELNLAGRNTELGGLMGAFLAGYGIAIFLWGFLVDRFGPRVCAMAGILCWGGFLFLSSRATSIEELLALRFFGDLQVKEIAEVMDIPMGSVGVFLQRVLLKVRKMLEQQGISLEDFVGG